MSGDPQVAELWYTKFRNLDNRCDPSKRSSLLDQLDFVITRDDLATNTVDTDTVMCALGPGKSDGRFLMSDHVLHAPPLFGFKTIQFVHCSASWLHT